MKYMVMECHPGYAVVLSDDGRFLKVANMRYELGQTVTSVFEMCLPEVREQPVKKTKRRWISAFAAMAACLVLAVTSIFFAGRIPYASVYMTINPEVRIDINRRDMVVGVEGMNEDGMDLLEGYDHRKKDLDTVMDELVDLAIEMGYLHEGGKITLSLDADEEWVVSHGEHLNQHLNEHLTDRITVTIDVEQKQSAPAPETVPGETFVIPVNPGNYGESDYGDDVSDNGDSGYGNADDGESDYSDAVSSSADTGYSSDDGDSGYDIPDDGQTDYDDSLDEEDSNYDSSSSDDAQSSYGNGAEDDGESNFGSDSDDDVQSDYDDADSSQSGYAAAPEDEAASDYDAPDSDDSQSDYESSDDDGQSGYESDDSEEASDYEENDD